MKRHTFILPLLLIFLLPLTVWAQTEEPTPTPDTSSEQPAIPLVHTVQEGETLTYIAEQYGVTIEEIQAVNNLANSDVLAVGQNLIIPGGEGEAVATVYTVQGGDTLAEISRMFNTTPDEILKTNRLINPAYQPVVGQQLPLISKTGSALPQAVTGTPYIVPLGETLPMTAARFGISTAVLAQTNNLSYPYYLFPGQRLVIPSEEPYRDLPGEWQDIRVRPLPFLQGNTVSIFVKNLLDGSPSGQFAGQPLRFFPYEDGYAALVGIDAFTEPGTYTLSLSGSGTRPWRPFSQPVKIEDAHYGFQEINVAEELAPLLEPEVRQNEDAFLSTFYTQFNETKAWDGLFSLPVTNTIVTAPYGDARSYNGGPVEIYHSGLDVAGGIGTPILATANGTVLFSGSLELRGNTVIIDHGLGVMSAYFHLSEISVNEGNTVVKGQQIGLGGSTGLSTGPHLHWELRIMDVPVNGLQWTEVEFP